MILGCRGGLPQVSPGLSSGISGASLARGHPGGLRPQWVARQTGLIKTLLCWPLFQRSEHHEGKPGVAVGVGTQAQSWGGPTQLLFL